MQLEVPEQNKGERRELQREGECVHALALQTSMEGSPEVCGYVTMGTHVKPEKEPSERNRMEGGGDCWHGDQVL